MIGVLPPIVCLILGLIITGLIVDLGGGPDHERIGFRYWKDPGAMAQSSLVSSDKVGLGRFLALIDVLVNAAFSFQGMELVAIAASETESPRRNISKAVRRVFYRILVFYVCIFCFLRSQPDMLMTAHRCVASSSLACLSRITTRPCLLTPVTLPSLRMLLPSPVQESRFYPISLTAQSSLRRSRRPIHSSSAGHVSCTVCRSAGRRPRYSRTAPRRVSRSSRCSAPRASRSFRS